MTRPFDSGTQYADWRQRNCAECSRTDCEIEEALYNALVTTGEVSEKIAEAMGYFDHSPPRASGWALTWDCPQRLEVPD